MKPFPRAAIWGSANGAAYGLGAASLYPNAIAPGPLDRWLFGVVAFGSVLLASTLAGWGMIRARADTPASAWRAGGIASCLAAGLVYVPVLYWVTITAYSWYIRDHGPSNGAMMTFLGGVLALPLGMAAIFLAVTAVAEGLPWLKRRLAGAGGGAAEPPSMGPS